MDETRVVVQPLWRGPVNQEEDHDLYQETTADEQGATPDTGCGGAPRGDVDDD